MNIVAVLLIGLAGWLLWTGRLQRMTGRDGMALGLAIVGAVMAAKGKPILGAVPIAAAVVYAMLRVRTGQKRRRTARPLPPDPADEAVAEASALLGVARDADADVIRAAHRRLIASVHPDRGGTEALAAKINAARDLLLRHQQTVKGSRPNVNATSQDQGQDPR